MTYSEILLITVKLLDFVKYVMYVVPYMNM